LSPGTDLISAVKGVLSQGGWQVKQV